MIELILASKNKGKIDELKMLLSDLPIKVESLCDYPDILDIEETGSTFAENAEIKAKAVSSATGKIALADDSGLEVDALDGQPGIYSSRFAGPGATDEDRNRRILELMAGVPDEKRTARFKAAVSIAMPDGDIRTVEGTCEGVIAHEPKGDNGFGYDPIFYLPELGKTSAQLTKEEKNSISHRGKAMTAAKKVLRELLDNV
ncbi:MAG: XTP/dITP diphosphatase [Armatimonadota bacterium]